ncbi:hypothetical protein niasHS_011819 [Heterodera schachtii]|uniref:C2H2-type domain-containing protein n=1 Tax=Heterodera schachtii TaxID=97005 RepID=A0ABD2INU2_HETSC
MPSTATMTTTETSTAPRLDHTTGWTCLACKLVFSSGQLQRDHYRSEWHLYNMKRQIANLPPVTECDFLEKLQYFLQHQQKNASDADHRRLSSLSVSAAASSLPLADSAVASSLPLLSSSNLSSSSLVCTVCRNKRFRSRNAFDNHLQSRRHKEEEQLLQQQKTAETIEANECQTEGRENGDMGEKLPKIVAQNIDGEDEAVLPIESDDNDDDEEAEQKEDNGGAKKEDGIPPNECLFCELKSDAWEANLAHMSKQHGFLVPDSPFCTDVPGLLTYLGFKVGVGLTCVRCQCARFRSLDALRKHMRDSNHCNFRIDSQHEQGDVLLEFMDFYDYGIEEQHEADEGEEDGEHQQKQLDSVLYDEGAFLVLPSGARIGHRSLVRYFRQRLGYGLGDGGSGDWHSKQQQRQLMHNAKQSRILKELGGPAVGGGCCSVAVLETSVKARARDVSFMKRTVARYQLRRALASNKLFKSRGRNDQQ